MSSSSLEFRLLVAVSTRKPTNTWVSLSNSILTSRPRRYLGKLLVPLGMCRKPRLGLLGACAECPKARSHKSALKFKPNSTV